MRRFFSTVVLLVLALVIVVFGMTFTFKNPQSVQLTYYFGLSWEGPISFLLWMACGVGILLGFLFSLGWVARSRRRIRRTVQRAALAKGDATELQAASRDNSLRL